MVTVGGLLSLARQMPVDTVAVRGPRGTLWALVGVGRRPGFVLWAAG